LATRVFGVWRRRFLKTRGSSVIKSIGHIGALSKKTRERKGLAFFNLDILKKFVKNESDESDEGKIN
jgi:hypothetical protein